MTLFFIIYFDQCLNWSKFNGILVLELDVPIFQCYVTSYNSTVNRIKGISTQIIVTILIVYIIKYNKPKYTLG